MNIIDIIFKTTKLNQNDIENLKTIEEFVIVEESEKDLYIEMLKLSQEIFSINFGCYTISINNKFLICFRSFQREIKNTFLKCLKHNETKILEESDVKILKSVKEICKLILLFIPEFITVYNLIIKIINKIHDITFKKELEIYKFEEEEKSFFILLLENFKFINLINMQNRKCCYSWFFRKELFGLFLKVVSRYHSKIRF